MTSSSSSIIWPECKPYGVDDLSTSLLPSEYVKSKEKEKKDANEKGVPGRSAWGEFTSTLKSQGVPFSVIRDVPARDREDLASAVFPWSAARQKEVLNKWPRGASYGGTLATRQSEADEKKRSRSRPHQRPSEPRQDVKYRQPKKTTPSGKPYTPPKKPTSPLEPSLRSSPWQQPAVARAKAAARAARTRSGSRGSKNQSSSNHPRPRPRPRDCASSASSRGRSSSCGRSSRSSRSRDSLNGTLGRQGALPLRSPSPARLVYPVGTVVTATRLAKSYPELNGVKGKVLGPAENNYIPVCFPAPFDEVVLHSSKLKPYTGQANDVAPRRSCLTRGTFHDFRWLHPSDPPPPPITIISYAASPPRGPNGKEVPGVEQGVVKALEQQVANSEAEFGRNDPTTLLAVWRLSILLCLEHRPAEALPHGRRAVEGLRNKGDPDNYVGAKCTLAAALHDSGLPDDAVDVLKPAVDAEGESESETNDEYLILIQMQNLAVLYQRQGDNAKAEPYARRALQGLAEQYGRQHTFTTAALANLAIVLHSQKMCLEAALLADRARSGLGSLDNQPTRLIKMRLDEIAACVAQAELDTAVLMEKDVDESTGATWTKTHLAGVSPGMTASACRMGRFKGRAVHSVNGRTVSRHSEISAMCEQCAFITFSFLCDTPTPPTTSPRSPATPKSPISPKSPCISSARTSLKDSVKSIKDDFLRESSRESTLARSGKEKYKPKQLRKLAKRPV